MRTLNPLFAIFVLVGSPNFASAAEVSKIPSDEVSLDRTQLRSMLQIALHKLQTESDVRKIVNENFPETESFIARELEVLDAVSFHRADSDEHCKQTSEMTGTGFGMIWEDAPGLMGYVHSDELRKDGVNICPAWFVSPPEDRNEVAFHELVHFLGEDEEKVADAVAEVVEFLNGHQPMITRYTWFPELTKLWRELYLITFPSTLFKSDSVFKIRTPLELRNQMVRYDISLGTLRNQGGYTFYCSVSSNQHVEVANGGIDKVPVLFPDNEVEYKVGIVRVGEIEANSQVSFGNDNLHLMWNCFTSAPILSKQMLEDLFLHHKVTDLAHQLDPKGTR